MSDVRHVNFTKTSRENLFKLINLVSNIGEIKTTHLTLATPRMIEEDGVNTAIEVEPTDLIRFQGKVDLKYNRLPLELAFEGKDVIPTPKLDAGSLLQQIDKINAAYGLALSSSDIAEATLGEVGDAVLVVRPSSLLFVPGSQVTLRRFPSLAQTFPIKDLSGFEREPYLDFSETFKVKDLSGFAVA